MLSGIRSIRLRATLLMCVLIIGVLGAYGALTYHEMRDSSVVAASERLAGAADQVASILAVSVDQMIGDVNELAADSAVVAYVGGDGALWEGEVLEVLGSDTAGAVQATELVDGSGQSLLRAGDLPAGMEASAGDLLSLEDGSAVGSLKRAPEGIMYPAVARIDAGEPTPTYVVRWRRLETAAEGRRQVESLIGPGAELYLVNAAGDIWTNLNEAIAPLPLDPGNLSRVVRYDAPSGDERLATMSAVTGAPWLVVIGMPFTAVLADARGTLEWLVLFGGALLILAGLAAWLVSGRFTRSIADLADAAAGISAGDYDRRTSVAGEDEVGTLGRAFNAMAESVAAANGALHQKVDELAAMQAENQSNRDRLERVVSSSRTIIYSLSFKPEGLELDWISDNVQWLLGYTPEEALEAGWWRRNLHPDDLEPPTVSSSPVEDVGNLTREYRFRHADGEFRWIRDQQRVLRDAEGQPKEIIGTLSDVTEQRELELAKDAAETANLAKSQFLSRMSHELRTPMNAILGFAQLLELDVPDDQNQESVRQILRAGRHLLQLIDEVLDLARVEAGGMALSVEPVELAAVVGESVELVQGMAAQRGVALMADCRGAFVLADQQRLKQVMLNLLSNAIKYNRTDGSVSVSSEEKVDGWTRISVTDTGKGISPAMMSRMFMPFERLDADRTRIEGTGLGLSLSKGLVEAMGGQVGFESVPDVGTTFWVDLPTSVDPESRALHQDEVDGVESHLEPRKVLYIEDNVSNLQLVERLLSRRGNLQIIPAMQGRIGLDLAREHRPDLILLDVHLPDLAGDKLLAELKSDPMLRDIPVIVISADATKGQIEHLLAAGAREYVTKPFEVSRLMQAVVAALGTGNDGAPQ